MKKYWFIYDQATGDIHEAQKVDTDEWTNVPDGCGVVGFEHSDVVLEAYENPHLYFVQNGELVVKTDADARRLEIAKVAKIAQLNYLCNQTILGGFSSAALGAAHQYGFDDDDQKNLTGRLAGIAAGTSPLEFLWKTKDAGPLMHTVAQFKQVCADGDAHKDSLIGRYWALKSQVEAAATAAEVDAVAW